MSDDSEPAQVFMTLRGLGTSNQNNILSWLKNPRTSVASTELNDTSRTWSVQNRQGWAIWSIMPLNFSNDLRNEEIQSTRAIGLPVSLTADATLWMGAATALISELATSMAASTAVTFRVSSWSDGVAWVMHECAFRRKFRTRLREDLGCVGIGSDI